LIDFDPILPGQTSPFKVLTTHNPAITKGSISFKYILGAQIPHQAKEDKDSTE